MVSAVQFDFKLKLPKGNSLQMLLPILLVMWFPLIRKVGFYRKIKKDTKQIMRSER
jgi:hypothetical protein